MNNYNRQSNSLIYEQYMKAFNSNNKNTHHNSYEKYFPPSNNNSVILPNIPSYRYTNKEEPIFFSSHENIMNSYNNYMSCVNNKIEHNAENYVTYMRNNMYSKVKTPFHSMKKSQSEPTLKITQRTHSQNESNINPINEYNSFIKQRNKEVLIYNREKGYTTMRKKIEDDINPYNPLVNSPLGSSFLKDNPILLQNTTYKYTPFLSRKTIQDNISQLMYNYHK